MIDKQLNDEAVAAHNAFRSMHGCPNLQFDLDLAISAQNYAKVLAAKENLVHSGCEDYGENLATRMSSGVVQLSGTHNLQYLTFKVIMTKKPDLSKEATQLWYDEINLHDFGGDFNPNSGHFTQVIWKETRNAGFGVAKSSDEHKIFVVGHYKPAGNINGLFRENVLPVVRKIMLPQPITVQPLSERKKKMVRGSYTLVIIHEAFKRKRRWRTSVGLMNEEIIYAIK
ncbi:hypothetical protein PHET_01787 [Paragonimus heterotremus]|uniref:SCP domain-containing protein n=1 Tax=Paragonimus heterotremus TaxID=100268 RepID=A0A8J4WKU1_9TREM|nr:hypothetical protein PHET_01787 [Paragonimus heterotremus]